MELGQLQGGRVAGGGNGGGSLQVVGRDVIEEGTSGIMDTKSNGSDTMRLADRCLMYVAPEEGYEGEDEDHDDDEDDEEEDDEDDDDNEGGEVEDDEMDDEEEDDILGVVGGCDDEKEEEIDSNCDTMAGLASIKYHRGLGGKQIRVASGGGYCNRRSIMEPYGAASLADGCFGPNKRLKLARNNINGSGGGRSKAMAAAGKFRAFHAGDRMSPASLQYDDQNYQNSHNNRSASAASYGSSSQASTLSPSLVAPQQAAANVYLQFTCDQPQHSDPEQPEPIGGIKSDAQVGGQQQLGCKLAIMSPRHPHHQQQAQLTEPQSASSSPPSSKWMAASPTINQQQVSGTIPLQHHDQTTTLSPPPTTTTTNDPLQSQTHLQHLNRRQPQKSSSRLQPDQRQQQNSGQQQPQQQLNQQSQQHLKRLPSPSPSSAGSLIHNGHGRTNSRAGQLSNNINRCDSDISGAPRFNLSPKREQRENGGGGAAVGSASERVDRFGIVDVVGEPRLKIAVPETGRVEQQHGMMFGGHQRLNPASQQHQLGNRSSAAANSHHQTDGHNVQQQQQQQQQHQQQELATVATKLNKTLKTAAPTNASESSSFMSNQASAVSSVPSSTSSSSSYSSYSSLSSSSNSSSSSNAALPVGYTQVSMLDNRRQHQHQHQQQLKNNEQAQRIPTTNNFQEVATTISNASNQSIETENHKLMEQQQQPQQNHYQQQQQPLQRQYPPNHPLGNTKHLCSICGDRATGKHYGVYSCEGCKGFFKRTIRKDIVYVCRSDGNCLIDMRQRNRCQYCRYQKCLRQGMKREAVQEEKQRLKLRACAASSAEAGAINQCDNQVESTSNPMIGQQTFNLNSTTNNNCSHHNNDLSSSLNNTNNHHLQHYGSNNNNNYISSLHRQAADVSPNQNHLSDIVEAQLNVCDRQSLHNNQNHHHHTTSSHNNRHQQHHYDLQQTNLQHNTTNLHHSTNQIDISPTPSLTQSTATATSSIGNNHYLASPNQHHYHQSLNSSNRLPVMRDFSSYYNATNDTITNSNINDYDNHHQPPRKYSRIDDLTLKWAAQMQIEQLLEWAKSVPNFAELLIDDQITLLKAYWNELIISDIAFKSIEALKENLKARDRDYGGEGGSQRCLCIGRGLFINENQSYEIGLSNMFDRIIDELVVKMHDMRIDSNELAYLRAIILFNPETQGLKTSQPIEEYRGNVYTALEMYCRKTYEEQPTRFGKLLLRLPALRSIGLKCDSMRRCDTNNNNLQLVKESQTNQQQAMGGSSPSGSSTTMLGYQVKLLFFDICYEASAIDSFLRSNLMYR